MRMYDLILKKKYGNKLSKEEIDFIVDGFTNGSIPDYQMSAFLMAVCFNGMDSDETLNLTMAMANSGDILDLSKIDGIKADKHSTGGVGDKTSLIITPMVAALGIPVAKMSGRGLGHTGGTIDKLESFPGFTTSLTEERFIENVNKIKIAIMGQTKNLAPADKLMYALRDVTGTVDSIPLISSSIMSKKIAAGADVIVLDVKTGSGAFMKTKDEAVKLAKTMVDIGNSAGRKTYAVISDMNQPLGNAVGNILEVKEAIAALNGNGPKDLMDACFVLAGYMLKGTGRYTSVSEAIGALKEVIDNRTALNKFAEFVKYQGGDESYVFEPEKFKNAKYVYDIKAKDTGYISEIVTSEIGMTSLILGGGRETKESGIDLSVGLIMHKKLGDFVGKDTVVAALYANDTNKLEQAAERFNEAYSLSKTRPDIAGHIYGIVTEKGFESIETLEL